MIQTKSEFDILARVVLRILEQKENTFQNIAIQGEVPHLTIDNEEWI